MKETGAVLGVGESRICQIHSAAMIRLRARMKELLDSRQAPKPAAPILRPPLALNGAGLKPVDNSTPPTQSFCGGRKDNDR